MFKHPFFLHHLNDGDCGDAHVDLGEEARTEDTHILVHCSDLRAGYSHEIVRCLVTHSQLARVFRQMNAPLDHQLEDKLLNVGVFLLHHLFLRADRVELKHDIIKFRRRTYVLGAHGVELVQIGPNKLYVDHPNFEVLVLEEA